MLILRSELPLAFEKIMNIIIVIIYFNQSELVPKLLIEIVNIYNI